MFSVIIPTYNRAALVVSAIESVLAQTFRDFDLRVIDDGSTDDTSTVLKRHLDKIQYIRQANCGSSAARNRGIRESRGKYIAFLDSDDRWYPDQLARIAEAIGVHPDAGVFYSDFELVDEQGNHLRFERCKHVVGDAYHHLLLGDFLGLSAAVVKRECFDTCGLFDELLFGPEDWDLWLRISKKFSFVHVPAVLVEHMKHTSGSVVTSPGALRASRLVIERTLKADPSIGRRERARIEAMLRYGEGVNHLVYGKKEEALSCFSSSIRLNPLFVKSYIYWMLINTRTVDLLPRRAKLRLRIL